MLTVNKGSDKHWYPYTKGKIKLKEHQVSASVELTIIEKIDKKKEAIDEINSQLTQSQSELNKLGQEAYKTWQQYTDNDAVIAALEVVEDKTKYLTEPGAQKLGLEWDEVKGQTIQQTLDTLLTKQLQLGEPTILTARLSIDTIDGEIATLEAKIDDIQADPTIVINPDQQIAQARQKIQELKNDKVEIATQFNIELTDALWDGMIVSSVDPASIVKHNSKKEKTKNRKIIEKKPKKSEDSQQLSLFDMEDFDE